MNHYYYLTFTNINTILKNIKYSNIYQHFVLKTVVSLSF